MNIQKNINKNTEMERSSWSRYVAKNCKQLWYHCQIALVENGDRQKPLDYLA